MADYDDATLEFGEVFLKDSEGHDVEVVGRLVEDEEVGPSHQHRGQMQAAAFAAAEGVDILLLVGGAEEEALQILHRGYALALGEGNILGDFGYGVDYLLRVVEGYAVLTIIAESDGLADVPATFVLRHDALKHLYECALAHAVRADEAEFFSPGKGVGEAVENHLVAEALRYALGFEYLRAYI